MYEDLALLWLMLRMFSGYWIRKAPSVDRGAWTEALEWTDL